MADFAQVLRVWYGQHRRILPWRQTTDPYRIWVSEIILQQTRVEQGLAYYQRFTDRFPDLHALAAAEESEVLKYWEGLGYYSRARNMLRAARQMDACGGFPDNYVRIRELHGVGDYTAAALASFAYGLPYAVVDGNVYRVLARYFGVTDPIDTTSGKKYFAALAAELLDREQPAEYNQAIMDFGALQCVPRNPDCSICPLRDSCVALRDKLVMDLPVKKGKPTLRSRYFTFIYINAGGYVALWRRGAGDIWEGLYQPLLFEWDGSLPDVGSLHDRLSELFPDQNVAPCVPLCSSVRQRLSHQLLHASFYKLCLDSCPEEVKLPEGVMWVKKELMGEYAYPKMLGSMLDFL